MANTPKGYPYPLGTDRVMDGDNVIQSLATAVDTKLGLAASGSFSVNITAAATSTPTAVTFPAGLFTAVPNVMAAVQAANPTLWFSPVVTSITTAGCTVSVARQTGTGTSNVSWLAQQSA
jgi:hypothetical protein